MPRGNPLDSENCRSCSSFSDYFKATKQKLKHDSKNEEISNLVDNQLPERPMRPDCPLDKDQLGTSTWGLLHTMAAKYPVKPTKEDKEGMKQFFNLLGKFYPCEPCAHDLRNDLKDDPPRLNNQQEFSHWLCQLHNKVNLKLDKPEFDCSKVNERWRDGWLDGSCD
ncbi:hypothetical protein RN001_009098 [Aquatica leii]|uniref:Sulfhydryl oxidase n=1 Tax=Aquatica leii TaxID=1421715 RepID=A0AAN7PV13_9COLE|nr:hypothetical protein RN001_009098 [Aquatica leii]